MSIHNKFEYLAQTEDKAASFAQPINRSIPIDERLSIETAMERRRNVAAKKRSKGKAAIKKQREAASRSVDQRIVKALSHPLRVHALAILNDRMASPNELSKELDEGLSQVSYHIKVLKDFECIELVKTEPRRGAVEHFYRARQEVFIPSWMLGLLPKSAQRRVFGDVLADIEQDVSVALETGTFDQRPDYFVGRDPRIFDGQGCEDADAAATTFLARYKEIEVESDKRRQNGEGDGQSIATTAVVLVFGSALGKKLKPSKKRRKR
jgi:DNA-binding transcriptional ArsR family regulator